MIRVFISSVQKEFAEERKALVKYIREDVLLCKFFQPNVYAALVRFLEEKEYLRLLPWDATMRGDATLADLDEKKISEW